MTENKRSRARFEGLSCSSDWELHLLNKTLEMGAQMYMES
jgi:hypothetical protein